MVKNINELHDQMLLKGRKLYDFFQVDEMSGYVLCEFKGEFVTWYIRLDTNETNYGHYHSTLDKAVSDFMNRICPYYNDGTEYLKRGWTV